MATMLPEDKRAIPPACISWSIDLWQTAVTSIITIYFPRLSESVLLRQFGGSIALIRPWPTCVVLTGDGYG